jgi:hypothetical protein
MNILDLLQLKLLIQPVLMNELERNPSMLSFEGNNDFQPCSALLQCVNNLACSIVGEVCTLEEWELTFWANSDSEGKQWSLVCGRLLQ